MNRRSSAANRGHSLIELTVSSTLLLMLVGFAFYAFLAGNRYQRRTEVQLEIENDALLTLRTLGQELSESHFRSVAQPAHGVVVFPLPRDAQGNLSTDTAGRVTWAKTVCYRLTQLEGEPYLVKQEQLLPTASATVPDPLALNPPHDEAFWVALGQGRKIARGAVTLGLTHVPTSPNRGLVQLRLEIVRKMDNRTYRLETQTAVYPRN